MSELTKHPLSRTVSLVDIAGELRRLARKGLPATEVSAGPVLPNLRSVIARAIHADDPVSRVDALTTLLTKLLTGSKHDRYAEPARILFGVAQGTSGTTLTLRRAQAARHLGYDVDHFRKRVEPQVLRIVAELVYRDMLKYKKRATGGDELASYATWTLTVDDCTPEEELSAIVWKFVYAIRAELIGARRQEHEPGFETRVAQHYDMAAKYRTALGRATANYRAMFGPIIRHGGVEYRVDALIQAGDVRQAPPA